LLGASPNAAQEGNTIVQVASLFNQLLQHFPRTEFAALVKKHAAERAAKGFTCWTQFVSMLFCQLGRADSLREICNGLGCCLGRLVHVGIARAPCRSTLSYANEHRPAAFFEDVFFTALTRFREQRGLGARQHKFRFKNKLLSLDSTTISLCLTMFPWAKFRRAKGGVKAHVLLDHDDYLPAYVLLTEAKRSDVKLADSFRLNPGSIVAIDSTIPVRAFYRQRRPCPALCSLRSWKAITSLSCPTRSSPRRRECSVTPGCVPGTVCPKAGSTTT